MASGEWTGMASDDNLPSPARGRGVGGEGGLQSAQDGNRTELPPALTLALSRERARGPVSPPPNPQSLIPNPSLSPVPCPLFSIRTPTAIVTDLGTEFGVEVNKEGDTISHVFRGLVEVRKIGPSGGQTPMCLKATESVEVTHQGPSDVVLRRTAVAPATFVRAEQMRDRIDDLKVESKKNIAKPWPLLDKTFVAWLSLNNLDQAGVGIISIEVMPEWDGIVFGELSPRKWMAGSDWWRRTEKNQSAYPSENAGPNTLIQIAAVYKGTTITLYRNGVEYVKHDTGMVQAYEKDSILLFGKRHLDIPEKKPTTLQGIIEEVRLYNRALSPLTIAALKPNEPSPIEPLGCWTFEDGTARDATGHFPPGELRGNARIRDGRLILDGKDSYLLVPAASQWSSGSAKKIEPETSKEFRETAVPKNQIVESAVVAGRKCSMFSHLFSGVGKCSRKSPDVMLPRVWPSRAESGYCQPNRRGRCSSTSISKTTGALIPRPIAVKAWQTVPEPSGMPYLVPARITIPLGVS